MNVYVACDWMLNESDQNNVFSNSGNNTNGGNDTRKLLSVHITYSEILIHIPLACPRPRILVVKIDGHVIPPLLAQNQSGHAILRMICNVSPRMFL